MLHNPRLKENRQLHRNSDSIHGGEKDLSALNESTGDVATDNGGFTSRQFSLEGAIHLSHNA